MRRPLTIAAVVAGHFLVLAALFWRVFFRDEISSWDCVVEYWPDLVFGAHAIGDGEWPGWNPYALGGYPIWADPQVGLYAPSTWLVWIGSAFAGDGPWMIQAKVLLNLLAGMCGMHAWSWARTRSHAAAAIAAWTFVIGAPLLVHKNGALIWPILYLPWALLALERLVARPTPRRGALLAGALWLVGTAGHPQGFFYGGLVLLFYWIYLPVAAAPRATHRTLARQAPGLAIALGLAGLLLAATWVPASRAVDASPRTERTMDEYVLFEPLEPGQLDELIAPGLDDDWQADIYVGPLPLVGALFLLICGRRRQRADAGFWLGVATLGVLLALARDGCLLPWLAEHVPGFDLFRIAYRYKLIFGVAAAVLAGDAVAALLRRDLPPWVVGTWLGLTVAWLLLAVALDLPGDAWLPGMAVLLVAAAAAAGGAMAPPWQVRLAIAAAVVVPAMVLADLWEAGASKLWIMQPEPSRDAIAARAAPLEGTDGAWRYHVGDAAPPFGGTVPYQAAFLEHLREQSGYLNPIEPRRHAEVEERARTWPEVLRHFNVRYLVAHWWAPGDAEEVAPLIQRIDDVTPLARWFGRAEELTAPEILDELALVPPSATQVAYVEPEDVRGLALPSSEGPPVDGELVRFARNEVAVAIDAPAEGILVLAEGYARGWTATVNGREVPVFRANYHQRAVVVPAGRSEVVFRYRPSGRVLLPLLFLLGLAGTIALSAGRWRWVDMARDG